MSHLFEGRIREIEDIILKYRLERAESNNESDKIASIMTYLAIHGRLTQQQLKQLTGFSISTISTQLANMVNIGYVKREMLEGSHQYVYFSSFSSNMDFDETLGELTPEIEFHKEKIEELKSLGNKDLKGLTLLKIRLQEVLEAYELYHKVLEVLKDPKVELDYQKYRKTIPKLTLADLNDGMAEFDPEIKKIEADLINFYLHKSAYSVLQRYHLIIYVYFMTRKVLTQKKIRELTKLSLGKVSKALNTLIKKKYIEKIDKDTIRTLLPDQKTRIIYYSMVSFQYSFFITGLVGLSEILKWETQFRAFKSELTDKKKELQKLVGYDKVLSYIETQLKMMAIYHKTYKICSKLLDLNE